MKSDFLIAITQLSAEKNLPPDVVIAAVESALVSAFRKDNFASNRNISVKIDPETGKVKVLAEKTVVEDITDHRREIPLAEAIKMSPGIQIGDTLEVEATPANAGRIAAQTAKQVILQRLHEAEHSAIFEEYAHKEGDIVNGIVQRIESRQITVDLGRAEAILPAVEQVRNERYRLGQRLKLYLLEVNLTSKGPQVVVSRSHRDLVRRLFEMEVPEVFNGVVEIKSVAREAGYRSKVAVAARQEGIDPVGCRVGLRGIRIQNIVNELNGEKIDVVMWNEDATVFIANALSPAKVLSVVLDEAEGIATVVVPDRQLSLAIGKEGQNARLAAKLTGWRIDIKSASTVEVAPAAPVEPPSEVEEIVPELIEPPPVEVPPAEPVPVETGEAEGEGEPLPSLEEEYVPAVPFEPVSTEEKAGLRFAEDIVGYGPAKPQAKAKKKKKGARGKEEAEGGTKAKKPRRAREEYGEYEEDDEF
ncbi:MAG TPA: transcription termination/antitermination protein NusA [Dehalococcoidia bacterium]|nr:transcription termination/antitermination protein NusA [Dehalococcoidia bacterium]